MTISEMHIAVNQGVDKIHSFQADVLLAEEIDHELNKNIMRFINQRFNKLGNKYMQGFEQSQKRIDDLRTLLTEKEINPTYKESLLGGNTFVDTVTLPEDDYLYLVKLGARTLVNKCQPIDFDIQSIDQINYVAIPLQLLDSDQSPLTQNQVFNQIVYHNGASFASTIDIFTGLINENNASTTNPAMYVTTQNSVTEVMQILLDNPQLVTTGFQIAVDALGPITEPGHLIITVDPNIIQGFSSSSQMRVQFGTLGSTTSANDFYQFELSDELYKRIYVGPDTPQRQVHSCKYVQHDDIFKLLSDPFNTTKFTAPLYTISGSNIELYSNDIFLIDMLKLLYIRKPAKVSLSSQVSCDLPEHTHQEVIDMTVSTILGNIGDPRYQIAAAEKLQTE
tara:strand:+ start:1801 stop:2979 length:1179 start_codon:yes stop_codon:yes gene_type:complete